MRVICEWVEIENMGVNGEERAQGQALRASNPDAGGGRCACRGDGEDMARDVGGNPGLVSHGSLRGAIVSKWKDGAWGGELVRGQAGGNSRVHPMCGCGSQW